MTRGQAQIDTRELDFRHHGGYRAEDTLQPELTPGEYRLLYCLVADPTYNLSMRCRVARMVLQNDVPDGYVHLAAQFYVSTDQLGLLHRKLQLCLCKPGTPIGSDVG